LANAGAADALAVQTERRLLLHAKAQLPTHARQEVEIASATRAEAEIVADVDTLGAEAPMEDLADEILGAQARQGPSKRAT